MAHGTWHMDMDMDMLHAHDNMPCACVCTLAQHTTGTLSTTATPAPWQAVCGDRTSAPVEMWEGRRIMRGSHDALLAHCRASAPFDVAIGGLLDGKGRILRLVLELGARRTAAMVHDHHQAGALPP